MTTTTYTGSHGTTYPHISTTGLTEADIDLMERIETSLLRWARTTPIHPDEQADAYCVHADALVLLETYGPRAVADAATPTDANPVEAKVWQIMRRLASWQIRLADARATMRNTRRSTANPTVAQAHVTRSSQAAAAGKTAEALYWIDAAEQAAPHAHNYDRYRELVAA